MAERMTNVQAVLIGRAIKAGWPHQKFDQATVDIWAQGLRHVDPPLRYEDCETAIYRLVTHAAFSGPEAVVAEVRRIRDERLCKTDPKKVTPNVDPDDSAAWCTEVAAIRDAIADGDFSPDGYAASGESLSGVPSMRVVGTTGKPLELEGKISLNPVRLVGLVKRMPATLPSNWTEPYRPLKPVRVYGPQELAAQEAQRAASLRVLEGMEKTARTEGTEDMAEAVGGVA